MDDSTSNNRPKIQFNNEEERQRKEQELGDKAKALRAEFESNFVPAHLNTQDEQGNIKPFNKVEAKELSDYLRKLGALAGDASGYSWEFQQPKISAELQYLKIEGSLRLAKSSLPGLLLFNVTFMGEVDFTGARFLGSVHASRVSFMGDAFFNRSIFSEITMFDRLTFFEHAYFSGAKLLSVAEFSKTEFKGDGYFIDASFGGWADFSNSIFGARALFHRSSFSETSEFNNTVFNDIADFDETRFSGLEFIKASFLSAVGFQDATFAGGADFSGSIFSGSTNFSGTTFTGQARFLTCQFKSQTIFYRSSFALCPRFHDALLHQDTSFSRGRFASMRLVTGLKQTLRNVLRKLSPLFVGGWAGKGGGGRINWDSEARAYRTLKLQMSKFQAQHEAAHFFAGEMRSRRREHGLSQPVHYLFSQVYDLFSEFGQSAGRVLIWLVLINSAFTAFYYEQAQEDVCALRPRFAVASVQGDVGDISGIGAWDESRPWVALSLQSLNPVAFLSPKNTWVRVYDGRIFLAGAGQSLLNLTLIILLGISLRGQFRRGAGGGD